VNFVHPKDAGGVLVELVQPASGPAPSPHWPDGITAPGSAPQPTGSAEVV